MKVILSHVARHHALETAFALQSAGWLERFYTSFYDEKHPPLRHRVLRAMIPTSLSKKMSNRYREGLDESKITSFYFPELLERTPMRGLIGRYNMMNLKGELFDRRVSMQDLECDIFHGFEGAVLHSMRTAKKGGAITILDYPMFHYETVRNVLKAEYDFFKIPYPPYLLKNDININRKIEEVSVSDYLMVLTDVMANDFIRNGKSPEKVKVVPCGFDTNYFQKGKKLDKVFRILLIGNIGFRKGIYYLLEAFKQIKRRDMELVLISPVEDDFKPILSQYGDLFKYIPSVPHAQLSYYYQNASVFILPALLEPFGMVVAEAMACGTPVIVSENCGMRPRDNQDGFVVPIRDIEALKQKILFLYENEDLRHSMGESAAEYVKQFTWANYHKNIQRVYTEISNNLS
jgi:glycosyltransferase involved in cell wall biosynthesis